MVYKKKENLFYFNLRTTEIMGRTEFKKII